MAGIASCLGVKTGIPTIGVAKSIYCCGGWTPDTVQHVVSLSLYEAVKFATDRLPKRSERGFVILRRNAFRPEYCSSVDAEADELDKRSLVEQLSLYCCGLGVPMEATVEAGSIQMCALVVHGGRFKPFQPTKNAIFISAGHRVSLQEAVSIAAFLSLARIPEPIRQADLRGRRLLREQRIEKDARSS